MTYHQVNNHEPNCSYHQCALREFTDIKIIINSDSLRRYFNQTDVTLFRFSALTFNGHKIHYSTPWCQQVEGHPSIVVHGPLNLIHILDMWRDFVKIEQDMTPASIEYRALNAVYAEEDYNGSINKSPDNENIADVLLTKSDGKTVMKATIVAR